MQPNILKCLKEGSKPLQALNGNIFIIALVGEVQ